MAKTFEGKTVSNPTENNKLFSPAQPQFVFMHNPNQWDLVETDDGFEVLPMLTKFQLIAGLNGVKYRPGGGLDSTAARASFMDRGFVFIDTNKGGDGGYLRVFDGHTGQIYVDRWTKPRKIGYGERAKVVWETDKEGYNEFRRSLIEDGTIAKPDPSAIDFKIELAAKRVERKSKQGHIPRIKKQADQAEEKRQALEEVKATKKTKVTKRKRAPRKKAATNE